MPVIFIKTNDSSELQKDGYVTRPFTLFNRSFQLECTITAFSAPKMPIRELLPIFSYISGTGVGRSRSKTSLTSKRSLR